MKENIILAPATVVPSTGWNCTLLGDKLLLDLVDPLPKSSTLITLTQNDKRNPEWHGVVVQVSESLGDRWKNVFKVGDRVVLNGSAIGVNFNCQWRHVVDMTSVVAILRNNNYVDKPNEDGRSPIEAIQKTRE